MRRGTYDLLCFLLILSSYNDTEVCIPVSPGDPRKDEIVDDLETWVTLESHFRCLTKCPKFNWL